MILKIDHDPGYQLEHVSWSYQLIILMSISWNLGIYELPSGFFQLPSGTIQLPSGFLM